MPLRKRHTERTKVVYASAYRCFVEFAGEREAYTEEQLEKIVEKLEKRYKPTYVQLVLRVGKLMSGAQWPENVVYEYSNLSVEKRALSVDEIRTMIEGAKAEDFPPVYRAYLLLSTLYGPRCGELAMLQASDINLEEGTVFIHTMKRGEERIHLLPDVARGYLAQVDMCPVCDDTMYGIFKSIQQLTGVQPRYGFGWHSIRRPLDTLLLAAGVNQAFVHYFLRWSMSAMEEKYIAPVEFEVDKAVFEHHPFLPFWEAQ